MSSVTRPKYWPAPLRAQRRSDLLLSTVMSSPVAVTRRAERTLSDVFPHCLESAQRPPPSA